MRIFILSLSLIAGTTCFAQMLELEDIRAIAQITSKDSLNNYLLLKGYSEINPILDLSLKTKNKNSITGTRTGDQWTFEIPGKSEENNLSRIIRYRNPDGHYVDSSQVQLTLETGNRFIYSGFVNKLMNEGFGDLQIIPGIDQTEIVLTNGFEKISLETNWMNASAVYKVHYQHLPELNLLGKTYTRKAVPRKTNRKRSVRKRAAVSTSVQTSDESFD